MTLDEIANSTKEMLTPSDIAPVLGCSPYSITLQARQDIKAFPFPVIVIGTRTKIPRIPFIQCMRGCGDV